MKFKSMLLVIPSLGVLSVSPVQADNSPFVGPSIALGMGFGGVRTQVSTSKAFQHALRDHALLFYSQSSDGKAFAKPMVDLAYGFPLSGRWLATMGVNADIGTIDAGTVDVALGPRTSSFLKLKNHTAVYLAPGMQLGPQWLVYGKLGYHQAKADFGDSTGGLAAGSKTLNGPGLGFGARYAMGQNLDLRMELEQIRFGTYVYKVGNTELYQAKPVMTRANLLLGHRF